MKVFTDNDIMLLRDLAANSLQPGNVMLAAAIVELVGKCNEELENRNKTKGNNETIQKK